MRTEKVHEYVSVVNRWDITTGDFDRSFIYGHTPVCEYQDYPEAEKSICQRRVALYRLDDPMTESEIDHWLEGDPEEISRWFPEDD